MNLEVARAQMLGQQIRAWEVLDDRVLRTLGEIPRERFVPADYRDLAFADTEIPLGCGQTMLAPKMHGRILQALQVEPIESVLEIGTGSGYLTACLAQLGKNVTSIEIFPELADSARANLAEQNVHNSDVQVGDALALRDGASFDVIAVTGSVPELDERLVRMLRPQGRLFVVVGRAPAMEACLVTMHANGDWTTASLFETVLTPLVNAERPEPFVL